MVLQLNSTGPCAERRTELLQRDTASKEPRCSPSLPGSPTARVWNLSLLWNSWPCLGGKQMSLPGGWCDSTPAFPGSGLFSLRTLYHQFSLTLCLLQPMITSLVGTLSPGLWSWEWTWPLSCQWSQVSASQMVAGRTSCRARGPSLHSMEVHLPLITLHTELLVLSCPAFHGNDIHCP